MTIIMTRHTENMRFIFVQYTDYVKDPNKKFDDKGEEIQFIEVYKPANSENNMKNNLLNILQLSAAHEIGQSFILLSLISNY